MDKEQLIKQYRKSIEELKETRQKIFELGFELKKTEQKINKIVNEEMKDILSNKEFKNQQQRELELKSRLGQNDDYLLLKVKKDDIQEQIDKHKLEERYLHNLKTFYSDICKLLGD